MDNLISDMQERGRFVPRGAAGYDEARKAWELAADLRPAAIAYPADRHEVAALVRHASSNQWRVAPIATGHNARALTGLENSLLLWTSGLTGVRIDPEHRRARVGGGVVWGPVIEQAAPHGLTGLHGSTPNAGVTGFSLGGGLSWYGRTYGLAANHVRAVELVTADGQHRRTDAREEPELFWALRGGGAGNFGVVTAIEFDLVPVATAYAGSLIWDLSEAPTVLPRWAQWAASAPESVTTSYRHFQFPLIPELPEPFRGRHLVVIDGAVMEDDEQASRLLSALRDLQPETDTFTRLGATGVTRIHMDPEPATPVVARGGGLFDALPTAAVDRLLEVTGPDAGNPLMVPLEVRQLGGALSREHPDGGVLDHFDGQFLTFHGTLATTAEQIAQALVDAGRMITAMAEWANGRQYLNFVEDPVEAASGFPASRWGELRRIKAKVDPTALFQAAHEIPIP